MSKTAEIKCINCVHLSTKSSYCCGDSFCSDVDMTCCKTNKLISGCETIFNAAKIIAPDWCPLYEVEDSTKDNKKGMKHELDKLRENLIIEQKKEQQTLIEGFFQSIKDRIYDDCKKKAKDGKFILSIIEINRDVNPSYHNGIIYTYPEYCSSLSALIMHHFEEIFKTYVSKSGEVFLTFEW